MELTPAILIIVTGVAADNLPFSGLCGHGFSIIHHHKWVLILLLLFVIQIEMVYLGCGLASWLTPMLHTNQKWVAIGMLVGMGIKMLQEFYSKKIDTRYQSFTYSNMIASGLGTSVYVLALSCAAGWLSASEHSLKAWVTVLTILFLATGVLLGKFHRDKTLKNIHKMSAFLVLTGTLILFIEKIK